MPFSRFEIPKRIDNWSLTSMQPPLVKTGGRLIKYSRYYWLLLAGRHLTRRSFGSMVRRIDALAVAAGRGRGWAERNRAGQEVAAERCFVDCAEKAGLPHFTFSRQGAIGACRSPRRPQRKCALRRIKSWRLDVYYLKTGIQNRNFG
jgi:hypothetical protein